MTLKLSSLQLRAILTLVISRQKGITLVVKNDALESLHVSSSFDSVTAIQTYIQREIESKVKALIRSDLPNIIHRLSQSWLSEGVGKEVGARQVHVETRTVMPSALDTWSHVGSVDESDGVPPSLPIRIPSGPPRHTPTRNTLAAASSTQGLSVPESIESFDPTYGMRPNALPMQSAFTSVSRLWRKDSARRGLGDVLSQADDDDVNERELDESWESVDLKDLVVEEGDDGMTIPQGQTYERIPAVGGGTITRPRVFHSHSQMRPTITSSDSSAPSASAGSTVLPKSAYSTTVGPRSVGTVVDREQPYFSSVPPSRSQSQAYYGRQQSLPLPKSQSLVSPSIVTSSVPRARHSVAGASSVPPQLSSSSGATPATASFFNSGPSTSFTSPPPSSTPSPSASRATSAENGPSRSLSRSREIQRPRSPPPLASSSNPDAPNVTLSISMTRNDSCAHLATLIHSNHTLSPYTRPLEHFTFRSYPRLDRSASQGDPSKARKQDPQPVRAKRKRIHRIGGAKKPPESPASAATELPPPPSESASGYFPSQPRLRQPSQLSRLQWGSIKGSIAESEMEAGLP
jgi:distribution and morphology protein 34